MNQDKGGIRVPFMLQWPRSLPQGIVYEHPVISYDVLPTSVAAAGGRLDGNAISGVNLLPFLQGDESSNPKKSSLLRFIVNFLPFLQSNEVAPHECLFWRREEEGHAVRCGKWKLLHRNEDVSNPQLYNLEEDIGETRNLWPTNDAGLQNKVAEMQTKLNAWIMRYSAE